MNFNELELRGVSREGIIVTLNLHRGNDICANIKTCILFSRSKEDISVSTEF